MRNENDSRRADHMDSLRQALRIRRRATRAELAEETGLSVMTIGKLLREMEMRGEVRQEESHVSGGGRPSMTAVYQGDYAHFAVIGIAQEAGENACYVGIFNLFGERLKLERHILKEVRENSFDPFLAQAIKDGYRLKLVAFALPGEAEGDCVFLCDFEGLLYSRFLPGIRARFGIETLFENDVNAAVFGHDFEGKRADVAAGIYFPKRFYPGAGIVTGGEILHGRRHFAGEIAFIQGHEAWKALDYSDHEAVTRMIGPLITTMACVLAPEGVVLYGDFFTPELTQMLHEKVRQDLRGQFSLKVTVSENIADDMECGIVRLALRKIRKMLREEEYGETRRKTT